jgi:hypothetical protein
MVMVFLLNHPVAVQDPYQVGGLGWEDSEETGALRRWALLWFCFWFAAGGTERHPHPRTVPSGISSHGMFAWGQASLASCQMSCVGVERQWIMIRMWPANIREHVNHVKVVPEISSVHSVHSQVQIAVA